MDIHDNTTKQAYIQLLIDSQEKKKKVLNLLKNVTEQQEELMTTDTFDETLFTETISIKSEQLQILSMIDEGFEKIYEGVKEELSSNKHKYEVEIKTLQELIKEVTDLSVYLQALEQRNKSKLDIVLMAKRKEIKDTRISSKSVANYYKTMSQQTETHSIFYDKKK